MPGYDSNKSEQSSITFFDLAGQTTCLFEQETFNIFDSINPIITEPEAPLEAHFWHEPQAVSPWNSYWTEAAKNGGGLSINDPVFETFWTKYYGLHINCLDKEPCFCEYNRGGTHSTIGRAPNTQRSQAKIKAQYKDYKANQFWADHGKPKLEKGKAVDHRQLGEILSWISGVSELIIIMYFSV
jgi:hypothetical protein